MRIGPKYKIARRLGAPVFEKTQTPKYALSLARKEKNDNKGRRKPKSEFGQGLVEKQKARYPSDPVQKLFSILESRLDNVVYRAGLAKTRAQARQAASHGHIVINNARVTIPSILLWEGDIVSLRVGSASSPLFKEVEERMKTMTMPVWLKVDSDKRQATVLGRAVYEERENIFNLGAIIEFYNR